MSSASPVPEWPSLYNFFIEVDDFEHRNPVQAKGFYLENANDIYRFTLYWTLIFYTPFFVICGIYAFLNLTFPPPRHTHRSPLFLAPYTYTAVVGAAVDIPLRPYTPTPAPSFLLGKGWQRQLRRGTSRNHGRSTVSALNGGQGMQLEDRKKTKPNERRSRLTFALLVGIVFAGCAVGGAVIGSAVMGYVMAGLFKAGNFHMSTWFPFLLGLIQTLVGLLGLWPSVVDII